MGSVFGTGRAGVGPRRIVGAPTRGTPADRIGAAERCRADVRPGRNAEKEAGMAENGNRGPNDFRARTGKRRREPPIIDASATEVPVDARSDVPFDDQAEPRVESQVDAGAKDDPIPDTTDAAPLPAAEPQAHAAVATDAAVSDAASDAAREASEPVLFGTPRREPPAGAEANRPGDATPADLPATDLTRASTGTERADGLGAAAAMGATASSAGADGPAAAAAAARTGGGATPWLLSLCILALLGALAWTLYTEPQRNGRDEIADLRGKVAALEARPDPAQVQSGVAALDKRLSAADADRAALAKTVAGLTSRVDDIAQQARQPAPSEPAPSGAEAVATVGALGALAAKLDGLDGRVAELATAQGQTAKSVADLPKPVAPDFGPVDAKVAAIDGRLSALDGRVTTLDGKVNGSDARLNAFDAKVNAVDGKINGFEARMNGFENRTNGIEAKLNDDGNGLGKLQATVANLPRVDLAPLQAAAGALDGRVAKVEGQLAAPKDGERVTEARAVGSADEARATPIALVGQAVARAVTDGRPYASDLAALKALGAEPAALEKLSPLADQGAPTAAALRDRWDAVQGDVLATVRPSEPGSAFERFAANARNLVQVRRVGAVQGDDPAALVSRIDAALASGDVQGALATWSKLPQAGQDKSRDWADAARSRVEAADAAQGIVSRAIATLARTKS